MNTKLKWMMNKKIQLDAELKKKLWKITNERKMNDGKMRWIKKKE